MMELLSQAVAMMAVLMSLGIGKQHVHANPA